MVRVALSYPKIPGSERILPGKCIAFAKYDGTNLHWGWERELGQYAFGTRQNRFDLDEKAIAEFNAQHSGYEDAVHLFQTTYADALEKIFKENPAYKAEELSVFTEYFGQNSFAGLHKNSDRKELMLFDLYNGTHMVDPEIFRQDFGHLKIAKVIYKGKQTGRFANDVREGKFNVSEGVVCKGGTGSELWMVKIKTNAYMEKLKKAFAADWEKYWE